MNRIDNIYTCICTFQPLTANEIMHLTTWTRAEVDLTVISLLHRGLITSPGIDNQEQEPLYCTPHSIEHVTT